MSDEAARGDRWFLHFAGRRIALGRGSLVIGRNPEPGAAHAVLPVSDTTVSRHHARLDLAAGRLTLRDLGSSNGTFVNDRRLEGEVELAPGDRLRLGRVRLAVARGDAADALTDAGVTAAPGAATPRRRFCPTCGTGVGPQEPTCPNCGENLTRERPLSRSEAIAMSEVMPVGEALALPPRRRDSASAMPWDAPSPDTAPGAPQPLDETTGIDLAADLAAERPADLPPGVAAPVVEEGSEVEAVAAEAARDAEEARPLFLPAAGFLRRTAAALVDAALVLAGGLGGTLVAALAGDATSRAGLLWVGAGSALTVWLVISIAGWWRWGTTPGKRLLRLWVCDLDGRPGLSAGRALARFAGYLLSAATLGYGYLRVGMAADGRALHDHLAGTYVAHPSPDLRLAGGRGHRRRFRRRDRRSGGGEGGDAAKAQ